MALKTMSTDRKISKARRLCIAGRETVRRRSTLPGPCLGVLSSYGVDLAASYRQFGVYAANILKGANPATLPVQQAVKFEMVLNLKTARELKLEMPPTILALTDEVIE